MSTPIWKLPPAVLVAVAVVQVGLTATTDLSPWKGGGFGMFATTDSARFRTLRYYALGAESEPRIVGAKPPARAEHTAKIFPALELLEGLGEDVLAVEHPPGFNGVRVQVNRVVFSDATLTMERLREVDVRSPP